MNKNDIQNKIYCLITRINPTWTIRLRYYAMNKKRFPMNNPVTFVEKLLWLRIKYYNNSPLVCECADKVTVREFVKNKGYGSLLNQAYGVYSTVEAIPWDRLPDQFAIKWNFGATYNIICDNVNDLDIAETKAKLTKWGKTKYYLPYAEMQYKHCKKKLLMEKYLDTNQGFLPYDYKLYCFDGEVKAILFIADRDQDKHGGFYTKEWDYIGLPGERYKEFETQPSKPKSLETMIECAEQLSQGIPFVRIDFYDNNGKAIFGEMTFTPTAGFSPATIQIDGHDMGDFIDCTKDYPKLRRRCWFDFKERDTSAR